MTKRMATLSSLLLVALLLSGCFGSDDGDADAGDDGDPGDDEPGDDHGDDHDDHDPEPINGTATLTGSIENGSLPLLVDFTIDAEPADNVTDWALDFGDATDPATGDVVPGEVNHTYNATGNFTVTLVVTFDDGSSAEDTVTVVALDGAADAPLDLHIEYSGTAIGTVPAGIAGIAGGNAADDETGFCDVDDHARTAGANETYIVFFDLTVPEGATRIYIEGGSDVLAADPVLDFGIPDYDVAIEAPDGTCVVNSADMGSSGTYEAAWIESPEPGDYTASLIYWAGPPAADYTGYVEINYGSYVNPPTG